MANDKPEPVVSRLSREVEDLNRLRKTRPALFYLVALIFAGWIFWYGWSQLGLVTQLKDRLHDSDQRVLLLDAQLGPFRTLALDRFPGAKEADAIAKLATQISDIQRQFEEASSQIRSFSIRIAVHYHANWVAGKMPDPSHLFLRGSGTDGRVSFRLVSGQHEDIIFSQSVGIAVQRVNEKAVSQQYTLIASPGDAIFTRKMKELVACEELQVILWDVSAASLEDAKVTIDSIAFDVLVDGIPKAKVDIVTQPSAIDIEKGAIGSAGVLWKGNADLKQL